MYIEFQIQLQQGFNSNPSVKKTILFYFTVGGAYSPDRCNGYELVDPKYFFPVPWLQANQLFEANRSLAEWEEFFSEAYSVDFFRTSMGNKKKVLRPKYYGFKKPAYSYLGPKFCPLSFFSERTF